MDDWKAAEDLSDYFTSSFRDNLQKHLLRAPSTEDVLAPTTHLIKKRREELEIHRAMVGRKKEFDNTLMAQRVRERDLKERETQMKEYLRDYDHFLKENQLKQGRALKKAERERELAHQYTADLYNLREELKALTRERNRLSAIVQKHEIYPRYLDDVVKASEQFQEPRQVMSRVDTLVQTRQELLSSTQQNELRAEVSRTQLCQYLEQKNDKLLHYNNRLAKLQSELDQARAEALLWENRWAHIQNTAAKKTLLLGTIKMASLNLYQTTSKRAKDREGPVAFEDTLKQLEKIQTFLCDLNSVWEEVNKYETKG